MKSKSVFRQDGFGNLTNVLRSKPNENSANLVFSDSTRGFGNLAKIDRPSTQRGGGSESNTGNSGNNSGDSNGSANPKD